MARYCSAHLGQVLRQCAAEQPGDVPAALRACFLHMDELLVTPAARKELRAYAREARGKKQVHGPLACLPAPPRAEAAAATNDAARRRDRSVCVCV